MCKESKPWSSEAGLWLEGPKARKQQTVSYLLLTLIGTSWIKAGRNEQFNWLQITENRLDSRSQFGTKAETLQAEVQIIITL